MARSFRNRKSLDAISELNITPLMDLAFSLLIIFMVTTPLLEQSIELKLPQQDAIANAPVSTSDFQIINVDSNGRIFWGKQEVDFSELNSLLRAMALEADPAPISLRCDRNILFQKVVDVLDAIKRNNLTKLHIDTEVK